MQVDARIERNIRNQIAVMNYLELFVFPLSRQQHTFHHLLGLGATVGCGLEKAVLPYCQAGSPELLNSQHGAAERGSYAPPLSLAQDSARNLLEGAGENRTRDGTADCAGRSANETADQCA
ncbi:hypothetical protein DQ240_01985 [Blastococcus sp. TF02A-26]|nr:hypothetical protein DQ240_01985 [Blastococcus sp. TF02A-26]